ncbi:hypothetical protein ACF1AL_15000 [Streptomyces sp. NPDC014801]|uniref:hypothetical protein n=1 Tax=Streptomyces sp. NPDC014801 TaxID=3364916 RepID=UPI0036FC65E7
MAHHPYPDRDRARRQIDRHHLTPAELRAQERALRQAATAEPGVYVLSTRRPGIVSGQS